MLIKKQQDCPTLIGQERCSFKILSKNWGDLTYHLLSQPINMNLLLHMTISHIEFNRRVSMKRKEKLRIRTMDHRLIIKLL